MALDSKNNIKSVFIVNTALSPVTSGTITPGSTNGGVAGSVVIANMSNEVLVAGSGAGTGVLNYSKIKIIKDRGADLPLQQLVLDLNSISAYVGTAGVAAREQVSYVGYDGTIATTRLGEINNNFYTVKLEHMPNAFAYGKRPANYKYGTYQSGVAATQGEIANGLVASLVQNFRPNRTTDWRVFSEVTNAGARTAATATAAVTLTFVKYSKSVKASAVTASTNIVAGDYVAIDAATTTGVYKVTSRDGVSGDLVLDIAYQGANTTITAVTNNIRIVAATANAANFGIKITGIKQKYDVNRWRQYDKVRFNVFIEGFTLAANATAVSTVAALDGTAVYEQVANDEYISWGDEGQVFVDQVPPLFREQDAVVGTQYNPVVLGWLDRLPSLIGAGENKGQAILYMSGSATTAGQGATLVTVLNSWLTGKFANLPGTLV
jgi:hypothetical protein